MGVRDSSFPGCITAYPPAFPYRRVVQNCGVSPQELIAEAEISAALARGEEKSEALRDRKGKPIDLDAYFATPPELRMAFAVLKSGEILPEELELLKEINRLKEQAASAADEMTRSTLRLKISELSAVYDMKMEAYRRGVPLQNASPVVVTLRAQL